MTTILLSAPYIIPVAEHFQPLFERYQIKTILAPVGERLSEGRTTKLCRTI